MSCNVSGSSGSVAGAVNMHDGMSLRGESQQMNLLLPSERSTCHLGVVHALWHPPVDTFQQHRQLRRRQRYPTSIRYRPDEMTMIQTLGVQAQTLPIIPQQLNQSAAPAAKGKQCAAARIFV